MKNLKEKGKKLFFKNILHLIIGVLLIVIGYFGVKANMDYIDKQKDKFEMYKIEQEQLIETYNIKLDSMKDINANFEQEQLKLNTKIDSISKRQNIINDNYEKEIDIIRDATLSEHAEWFNAKLDSIRHSYKPNN